MVRSLLVGLVVAAAFCSTAEACTILVSPHKPGSPEAIAEERTQKQDRSSAIAEYQLVFVGRKTRERDVNLGEIVAGGIGLFGNHPPAQRSWFEPATILKGSPDLPTTNVLSGEFGGTCGYAFWPKVGDLAIVYASRQNGYWVGGFAPMDILPYLEPLLR